MQDLFLNETANYAHVFLPGSTFLEKNGTFINAERRIQLVRKVMAPKNGYEDWEITCLISDAMGYPMHYDHPSEIMAEIARLTPTFAGVSFERIEQLGSIEWPCNDKAPRHAGHAHRKLRSRQGQIRRHRLPVLSVWLLALNADVWSHAPSQVRQKSNPNRVRGPRVASASCRS